MAGEEKDVDLERVQAAINLLSEHFDTVQVFCTRHEPGELDGTVNVNLGAGNYYTRSGQIREWLVKQNKRAEMECRNDD